VSLRLPSCKATDDRSTPPSAAAVAAATRPFHQAHNNPTSPARARATPRNPQTKRDCAAHVGTVVIMVL
jgi:hypothetical protein